MFAWPNGKNRSPTEPKFPRPNLSASRLSSRQKMRCRPGQGIPSKFTKRFRRFSKSARGVPERMTLNSESQQPPAEPKVRCDEWLEAIPPGRQSRDVPPDTCAVRPADVRSPLTPALSLGEREN